MTVSNSLTRSVTYDVGVAAGEWDDTRVEAVLGSTLFSRDVLAHEFGHGIHRVARDNFPIYPGTQFATQRAMSESIGDSLGLLLRQRVDPTPSLALDDALGHHARDYGVERCDGYSAGSTCDFRFFGLDTACGPQDFQNGCAEYTHLDTFPDDRLEPDVAGDRLEPHLLGCALTRPLTYALQPGPRTVRGVHVDHVSADAAALAWHTVYAGADRNKETVDDWDVLLRRSFCKLDEFCGNNPTASACATPCPLGGTTLSCPGVMMAAGGASCPGSMLSESMFAAGFWSAPDDALGLHHTLASDYTDAGTGIAAAVTYSLRGDPTINVLYGQTVTGTLLATTLPNLFATAPYPTPVPFSGLTTFEDPAMAVDPVDSVLNIAIQDATSGYLAVGTFAMGAAGAFFHPDARFATNIGIVGGPAIAVTNDETVYVAYERTAANGSGIAVLQARPGMAVVDVSPGRTSLFPETAPALASDGSQVVLLTLAGPYPNFPDTLSGADIINSGGAITKVGYIVLSYTLPSGGAGFDSGRPLYQLPLFLGRPGVPPGILTDPRQETLGPPLLARVTIPAAPTPVAPTGGAGAVFFGGRLNVLLNGEQTISELPPPPTFAQYSYVPSPDPEAEKATASRFLGVQVPEGGLGRPAVFVVQDPTYGTYVGLLSASRAGRIGVRYRRSN